MTLPATRATDEHESSTGQQSTLWRHLLPYTAGLLGWVPMRADSARILTTLWQLPRRSTSTRQAFLLPQQKQDSCVAGLSANGTSCEGLPIFERQGSAALRHGLGVTFDSVTMQPEAGQAGTWRGSAVPRLIDGGAATAASTIPSCATSQPKADPFEVGPDLPGRRRRGCSAQYLWTAHEVVGVALVRRVSKTPRRSPFEIGPGLDEVLPFLNSARSALIRTTFGFGSAGEPRSSSARRRAGANLRCPSSSPARRDGRCPFPAGDAEVGMMLAVHASLVGAPGTDASRSSSPPSCRARRREQLALMAYGSPPPRMGSSTPLQSFPGASSCLARASSAGSDRHQSGTAHPRRRQAVGRVLRPARVERFPTWPITATTLPSTSHAFRSPATVVDLLRPRARSSAVDADVVLGVSRSTPARRSFATGLKTLSSLPACRSASGPRDVPEFAALRCNPNNETNDAR